MILEVKDVTGSGVLAVIFGVEGVRLVLRVVVLLLVRLSNPGTVMQ
jgi:hypothetical protein